MNQDNLSSASKRYDHCIRDTLSWILDRQPCDAGFLNTKVNPVTGADYDHQSGMRGPGFTYGWIQGRGLEALTTFAIHYRDSDPVLSGRLSEVAQSLYHTIAELHSHDGHAYFVYDSDMRPVRQADGVIEPQIRTDSIYTYSDAFVSKGLFAASCLFEPDRSQHYLNYLLDVIAAIENNQFQMDESRLLDSAHIQEEADDFGPRMILLGASGVLHRHHYSSATQYADRFINDVLTRYKHPTANLLLNAPGQDACNIGHAIEFCGFAFEHLQFQPDRNLAQTLETILANSLELGLQEPGIVLSLSATTGKALSPYYPWWPLPEAIRACALGMQLTDNQQLLPYMQRSDELFFRHYWKPEHRFAYQTRTLDGPVDFVPATPDLDPGYHTGLSLLRAIEAITAMQGNQ